MKINKKVVQKVTLRRGEFAAAVNCMDGRVQLPVAEWLKREYGVSYVDMITEAGPSKILSEGSPTSAISSIRKNLMVSVDKHSSRVIAVVAHHDCAGNPVNKETQLKHIAEAVEKLKLWNLKARIVGLWVGEDWKVERVV